jgi:hypothetical protein
MERLLAMTVTEAKQLIDFIPASKIKSADLWKFNVLVHYTSIGLKLSASESKFLQEVYRYTQGGDRESQPFKQYRRPKSKGI